MTVTETGKAIDKKVLSYAPDRVYFNICLNDLSLVL